MNIPQYKRRLSALHDAAVEGRSANLGDPAVKNQHMGRADAFWQAIQLVDDVENEPTDADRNSSYQLARIRHSLQSSLRYTLRNGTTWVSDGSALRWVWDVLNDACMGQGMDGMEWPEDVEHGTVYTAASPF